MQYKCFSKLFVKFPLGFAPNDWFSFSLGPKNDRWDNNKNYVFIITRPKDYTTIINYLESFSVCMLNDMYVRYTPYVNPVCIWDNKDSTICVQCIMYTQHFTIFIHVPGNTAFVLCILSLRDMKARLMMYLSLIQLFISPTHSVF